MLANKELEVEYKIDKKQAEFFIKGGLQLEEEILDTRNLQESAKRDEDYDQQFKKQKQVDKNREKDIPWITSRQWRAIDRLSRIPPFNQPNPENKAANLAQHIE